MQTTTWLALLFAGWAISLSPGAGAIASMTSGLRHGFRRAWWTILGLQLGFLLHLAVVALGLGALLIASDAAFAAVKWTGVAYLAYLGVRQILARPPAPAEGEAPPVHHPHATPGALVLHGFLVNASNPKAIVFMLAVLPQFIDPARPALQQYTIIAVTLALVDCVVMGGYSLLAGKVLHALHDPARVQQVNRIFGSLFLVAAALLAAFHR